jgi:hypothetical protein
LDARPELKLFENMVNTTEQQNDILQGNMNPVPAKLHYYKSD